MTKVEYFKLVESPYNKNKHTVSIDFEKMPPMTTVGSYNLLAARLMNLSYAQYLRFCRDKLGGEISGKNKIYPVVYLPKTAATAAFIRLLNDRMNLVNREVCKKNVSNS